MNIIVVFGIVRKRWKYLLNHFRCSIIKSVLAALDWIINREIEMRRCSWDVNFNTPLFRSTSPVKLVHRKRPLLVLATKYSTYIKTQWLVSYKLRSIQNDRGRYMLCKSWRQMSCCVNPDLHLCDSTCCSIIVWTLKELSNFRGWQPQT